MQVIGLTGGIASGKSLVSEILRDEYEATVISGDELGHQAYLPDTDAWKDILARWGDDLMNPETREIDRRKLGAIVFSDPAELTALNEITWPRIRALAEKTISDLREGGAKIAVLEAAIMIEAGWTDMCDELWVTEASEADAIARLQSRNGLTEEQAKQRINAQLSNEARADEADVLLQNTGTIEELRIRVGELWHARIRPFL
ncbi:MAG: dephospho-CoA kinase [Dehalococcoidia bacterium]|nr:dephospho-CoA kinase [Dehalococcoidia bacterium]